MSNVEVPVELLSSVTQFIKLSAEEAKTAGEEKEALQAKVAELEKSAKEASAKIDADTAKASADALVQAGLLSVENVEKVAASLQDPAQVHAALVKVADAYRQRPLGVVEKQAASSHKPSCNSIREAAKADFASAVGVNR